MFHCKTARFLLTVYGMLKEGIIVKTVNFKGNKYLARILDVFLFNLENPSCCYGYEFHSILPFILVPIFVIESVDQCIKLSQS